VVGPEGRRPWLGALLLAYYGPDGRLVYAGRVGTGIKLAELERLWRRLQPLVIDKMRWTRATAPIQPLWVTTDIEPRALGAARARGRGQVSDLDRR
jgi:ATP-dependent DNA ligase